MNIIQRAWLVALRPVSAFVNDKMAKKSGLIGRIGRFFAIGPRQFGYHPTNKWLAYVNQFFVQAIGSSLHRRAFLKQLSGKGFFTLRTGAPLMLMGPIFVFYNLFYLTMPTHCDIEDGTSLTHLKSRVPLVPLNALNDRTSAHYTQINNYYMVDMLGKYSDVVDRVSTQRQFLDDRTKKTRYARPGYNYIEPHTSPDGL